jgi:hypothetical protein
MKGRKPEIHALNGALDKAPPAPAWLPRHGKTEWAHTGAYAGKLEILCGRPSGHR